MLRSIVMARSALNPRRRSLACWIASALSVWGGITLESDGFHVRPGDRIQDALDQAATHAVQKTVWVHAGTYRPDAKRQALVWFNRRHDGIRLVALGEVTLSAANPEVSANKEPSYPAVVNHVVYFGDGISTNTLMRGFRLTGANAFLTQDGTPALEPNRTILKNHFFYSDGGAVKVFGRSAPRLVELTIEDNFTRPCGAGISVQQQGFREIPVLIASCRFLNNRAQGTGPAIDLLAGSSAKILNCLFVGNISNTGEDLVAKASGEKPFANNGAITIFWESLALVQNCTFTGNRNGVDDMGGDSVYVANLFHANRAEGGLPGFPHYELAINAGGRVENCAILGPIHDAKKVIDPAKNRLQGPDPRLDADWVPQTPEYAGIGYRPMTRAKSPAPAPALPAPPVTAAPPVPASR
jgi:hypothetical protein